MSQAPAVSQTWMPHPYRSSPGEQADDHDEPHREERILYVLLVMIGTIPLSLAWIGGNGFGVQATLGTLMLALGCLGLLHTTVRARRS